MDAIAQAGVDPSEIQLTEYIPVSSAKEKLSRSKKKESKEPTEYESYLEIEKRQLKSRIKMR